MIILQIQPMPQMSHFSVFATAERQPVPLRKIPVLSEKDSELFAKIERSTRKMTKQDLIKAMGIGANESTAY